MQAQTTTGHLPSPSFAASTLQRYLLMAALVIAEVFS